MKILEKSYIYIVEIKIALSSKEIKFSWSCKLHMWRHYSSSRQSTVAPGPRSAGIRMCTCSCSGSQLSIFRTIGSCHNRVDHTLHKLLCVAAQLVESSRSRFSTWCLRSKKSFLRFACIRTARGCCTWHSNPISSCLLIPSLSSTGLCLWLCIYEYD